MFVFTWPTFDIIGRYTTYAALFMNVTWKPIPHESKVTIDDVSESICFLDDMITAKPYLGQAYISKTKFTFNKSKLEFEWKDFIVKVNDI